MTLPRAALAALVLLSTAFAGCLTPAGDVELAGLAATPALPEVFGGFLHEWADVDAGDGLVVHLDLWRPDPATYSGADPAVADQPVPVVFDMGPYFGNSKENADRRVAHYVHDWAIEDLVPRGYAFAAVELSGTAGSTGCWDFMGPEEVASTVAAVEWLGTQPWSNGKVGMIGKSYDAMTQVMAASQRPEHLATIVPVAPLTHAYAGLYMNGVPYLLWYPGTVASYQFLIGMGEPPLGTPERQQNYVARTPDQARCAVDNMAGAHAGRGDYDAYYEARDFRASAKEIDIPVFFMQGFLDRNVRPDNALPYVNDLAGPKMVWLGQWYHDYPNATWAGREDMYLQLHRWFDRWLKGVENGIEADLGFHIQDSEGRWRQEASWPPADAKPLSLRLADGKLSSDPGATGAGAAYLDDGRPLYTMIGEGPSFLPTAVAAVAHWASEPFAAETILSGPVRLALNASSSGTGGQVVAVLMDCATEDPKGDCAYVTRGAFDLKNHGGLAASSTLAPGEIYSIAFELQPRDHVFAPGRYAVLTLTGADGDWFTPEGAGHEITVHESADAPSTIELPTVARSEFYLVACGERISDKPCYREGLKDKKLG